MTEQLITKVVNGVTPTIQATVRQIGMEGAQLVNAVSSTGAELATEDKQDDIITEIQKLPNKSLTPIVYNITLTDSNTEYSQALPANTKDFRWRCRTLFDVRYAWETAKVATPTAPYLTLPGGSDYYSDGNDLSSKTLYFASSEAGVVIEMEIFT